MLPCPSQVDYIGSTTLSCFDDSSNRRGKSFAYRKCLVPNARSLRNKITDLHSLLLMESFDIVAITETRLNISISDHELHLKGYNVYRKVTGRAREAEESCCN